MLSFLPPAAQPIAVFSFNGYTYFTDMGKGKNDNCASMSIALDGDAQLAARYGDDLEAIRGRLGASVRQDGSTPDLASLVAPASDQELEEMAARYGTSLEGEFGRLTQSRVARNNTEARQNKLSAYERMVDLNVISGSMLVRFSRVAGMVLRHHPDPRMRSRAAEILIMVNQRGVIEMAGRWWAMTKSQGFTRDEMMSAAQEGLMEAAEERDAKRRRLWAEYDRARASWMERGGPEGSEREPMPPTEDNVKVFDPEKASFYTYAKQKMHMRCQRYAEQNSGRRFGLPIPTEVYHQVSKIMQERAAIEDAGGRDATKEMLLDRPRLKDALEPNLPLAPKMRAKLRKDLLAELGEKPTKEQVDARARAMRMTDLEEKLEIASRNQISLSSVIRGSESNSEFEQFLQDDRQNTAQEAIWEAEGEDPGLRHTVESALTPEESRYLGALDLREVLVGYQPADNAAQLAEREGQSKAHVLKVMREGRKKLRQALVDAGLNVPQQD